MQTHPQFPGRVRCLHEEEGSDLGLLKKAMMCAMVEWFVEQVKIVVKVAEKYAALLWEVDVGTIEKLKKKLVRNPNLLIALNFDEDDVEDILNILLPDLNKADNMKSDQKIPRRTYSNSEVLMYICTVCMCICAHMYVCLYSESNVQMYKSMYVYVLLTVCMHAY